MIHSPTLDQIVGGFLLGSLALTLFWTATSRVLVAVLRLEAPGARFVVFLAPLMAAFFVQLRLSSEIRLNLWLALLSVAALLITRDGWTYWRLGACVSAQAKPCPALQESVDALARRLNTASPRVLQWSETPTGPFLIGFQHPAIVLPEEIVEQLGHREIEALLAHELAHLLRRDCLWKWLILILRRLAFWNPVAKWPYQWLSLEMERACDRRAAQITGAPGALARALCSVQALVQRTSPDAGRAAIPHAVPGETFGLATRLRSLADPATVSPRAPFVSVAKTVAIFGLFAIACSHPGTLWLLMCNA